ncbi:transposase [Corynebacterium vitaeruminis]|uniref:Transposase for insertion sequence element n=1 Tax=Corynebacterium vitaeruminis DSM 20294 TaxID=1224164 RepID=W5Y3J4_9CORY|nr:transposase [Corynebacterium vitaeruminis]AHI23410.1 transposase for insertion sequence element [Corynebacterium vitaeruminis DSM 20294]
MPANKKYPDELRDRAVRLVFEAKEDPTTANGAVGRIAEQLGINKETLRGWVYQARIDSGAALGTTTADSQRIAELEREVTELRRANSFLKQASAFFAAELDRPYR